MYIGNNTLDKIKQVLKNYDEDLVEEAYDQLIFEGISPDGLNEFLHVIKYKLDYQFSAESKEDMYQYQVREAALATAYTSVTAKDMLNLYMVLSGNIQLE